VIIAVASGKGGTGKTSVAVGLALSLPDVQFLDCDVEEPNAALFLRPEIAETFPVGIPVPEVDEAKCAHCGKCAALCAYNAILDLGKKVLVFPHLCHGCGGCTQVCPEKAISEKENSIGIVNRGRAGDIDFVQGTLNVGEPMATPIIKKARRLIDRTKTVILDSPPGTSCPMIETVRDADFCLLVTEPTPFGLNDLRLAVETVRQLQVPFGVVINCSGIGNDEVKKYCAEENIPLLLEIPWDRRIAEGYSRGEPIVSVLPDMKNDFLKLLKKTEDMISTERKQAAHSKKP